MSEDYPNQPEVPDTFRVTRGEDGRKGIECLMCGRISYHPKDIAERYCGECQMFHHDILPTIRQWLINKQIES